MATDVPDLRPKHNWLAWLGGVCAALTMAWNISSHFNNTPTRQEFEQQRNDQVQMRLDMAVAKANAQRTADDVSDIKVDLKALRESLDKRGKH